MNGRSLRISNTQMLSDITFRLVILSFAVASTSYTISKTHMFEGFRTFIKRRSKFFGDLLNCPYCLSHWFAFPAAFEVSELLIRFGYVITIMAIVGLSAIIIGVISKLFEFL